MAQDKQPEQSRTGSEQGGSMQGTGGRQGGLARSDPFGPSLFSMSPFSLMRRFTEEMDQLFDQFGFGRGTFGPGAQGGQALQGAQGGLQRGGGTLPQAFFSPQVEVFERGGKLVVRADLPGLTKDDVHVQVTDDALIIEGERRYEHEDNEGGVYRSERSYGRFRRW